MNKGIGRKANVAIELKKLAVNCSRPSVPPQNTNTPIRHVSMKAQNMGMPVIIKATRQPKMSSSAKGHATDVYLQVCYPLAFVFSADRAFQLVKFP